MFSFTLRAMWFYFHALVSVVFFLRTPSASPMVLAFARMVAILITVKTLHYLGLWRVAFYMEELVVDNNILSDALICDVSLFREYNN